MPSPDSVTHWIDLLQAGDHAAVAVAVGHRVCRDAGQQVSGSQRAVAGQEDGALVTERGLLGKRQLIRGGHELVFTLGTVTSQYRHPISPPAAS